MARTAAQCVQCGQVDDHPKDWGAWGPKHYDCLSFQEQQDMRESNPAVYAAVTARESGLRGDDLLKFILDNAPVPSEAEEK